MTRSMTVTRRAALLAGAATATAVALAACGTGQIAETANMDPSVHGINTGSADGAVLIRGLAVGYGDVEGYAAGGTAPIEVALFNETREPVTVRIGSAAPARDAGDTIVSARQILLTGQTPEPTATGVPPEAEPSGSPGEPPPLDATETPGLGEGTPAPADQAEPTGTPTPDATPTATPDGTPTAAGVPAEITIPPLSSVFFIPNGEQTLVATGLSAALRPGMALSLVFEFDTGAEPLVVPAGVGVPLTPAPRETPGSEGEH